MTLDLFGLAALVAVLLLGAILTISNSRQARALEESRAVLQDWYLLLLRDRRARRASEVEIGDPLSWLGAHCSRSLLSVERVLEKPRALLLLAEGGERVVVSPLDPAALRASLSRFEPRGRYAALTSPLLGARWGRVQVIEQNLLTGGEWFDLEAARAGAQLGAAWGEPARLWFYIVPKSA